MKKLLSLLTLTLAIALSSYAKTTIKISNPNDPATLKDKVTNALKAKSPALANNAAFVSNIVKQVQNETKNLKASGSKTFKVAVQAQSCADIYIFGYIIDYYDGDGNYLGSEVVITDIIIIIYDCPESVQQV